MHHIELLGDTRSADDVGVFCSMPAERMCVGCGFSTSEGIGDSHPNQRPALLEAASRLLGFVLLLGEQPCEDEEKIELRNVVVVFTHQVRCLQLTMLPQNKAIRDFNQIDELPRRHYALIIALT